MKIVKKGEANMHDLVHVTCDHCNTNVIFWRDEPNTRIDYFGTFDDGVRFNAYWTCPVCNVPNAKTVIHIDPIYEKLAGTIEGIEKDRVLTPEEKAEMEEALLIEE